MNLLKLNVAFILACGILCSCAMFTPNAYLTIDNIDFRSNPTAKPMTYNSIYNNYIYLKCIENDVPYPIVNRLLYMESRFNKYAIGSSNCNGTKDYGIAQVNSAYIDYFKWKYFEFDVFNPYQSIDFCIKHLYTLYCITNDWYLAVAAYNAGLSRIQNVGIPESTQAYCNAIMVDLVF